MSAETAWLEELTYLNDKPGVKLIKAGTYKKKELNDILGIPNLESQIIDVPVCTDKHALQMGYFSMQPSEDFEFTYTFLEIKIVFRGKIIVRDDQGKKYVAEEGDVFVFSPTTTVIFDGESDGDAFYTAHRLPEPSFV
ncbi:MULTISPECIES: cupin domain-containing protein [Bacillaceae]|uniref:(S)-ureidoglycine aminohydrolase cupin domain-containing protein n=1 Tax=Domibacillus aminovorans TaxID=29332 RepID=A0A177LC04_9BACI|nr:MULTISPECIES: cupin domain-containing protein [Bacillaceae]OAH58400.1 hypothetical protein AWH48_18700 [Domibacillus aminovorans]OAH63199.1 hypothetical protein AWH49_06495 [Domibacillus aminovorans]